MTIILSNGVRIDDEELPIWLAYNCRCVCHPERWAVCLHEEPPRSLNPNWKNEPLRRFPVCYECHERAHRMGRDEAGEWLESQRNLFFPEAVEWIQKKLSR